MYKKIKMKSMLQKTFISLIFSIFLICYVIDDFVLGADILAFPGAQGAGQWATGGRGGKVIAVTNLNDSGPGSLRDAVEQEGPRIIVFRVSGTIELMSDLEINNPDITIEGQTAPGDGICLKDGQLSIVTENVIIRYIRVRLGNHAGAKDAIHIENANNVIIDHCSASYSVDETLSVDNSDKVTVQWCIIANSLTNSIHEKGAHGFGSLLRGSNGQTYSFYHNLYANNSSRNPRPGNYASSDEDKKGLILDFRNNVIYNWGYRAGYNADKDAVSYYNFINNYYKKGPNSETDYAFVESSIGAKAYFRGNIMNGEMPSDPWSLVSFDNDNISISEYKQNKPFEIDGDIPEESAEEAYKAVLEGAGASFARDSLDTAIINDVKNGTGKLIDRPEDAGGWPELKSTEPPADSDNDGIPDSWEVAHKLNPNDSSDASSLDKSGYSYIEIYANSIVEKESSGSMLPHIIAGFVAIVIIIILAVINIRKKRRTEV